jgi:hypothetical protein
MRKGSGDAGAFLDLYTSITESIKLPRKWILLILLRLWALGLDKVFAIPYRPCHSIG